MRRVRCFAFTLMCLAASVLGLVLQTAGADAAPGRAALLIANAAYPDSDAVLSTPVADTRALGEELKRRGFSVDLAENVGKDAMQAAIDRFLKRVEPGSVAMVFFAGYGIQVARRNYLIPVDAAIWGEANVKRDGMSVDDLMSDLDKRGASVRVLVLDASRRNPFERRFRSFSTGLAPTRAAPGTLAFTSAAPGSLLTETTASRSLFVTELIKQIGLPDLTAEDAFGGCRDAIAKATRSQQNPAIVSGLEDAFSFDLQPTKPLVSAKSKTAPPQEVVAAAPSVVIESKPAIEPMPTPPVIQKEIPKPEVAKPEPPKPEASHPAEPELAAPPPPKSSETPAAPPEPPAVVTQAPPPEPEPKLAETEPDAPPPAVPPAAPDAPPPVAPEPEPAPPTQKQPKIALAPPGDASPQAKEEEAVRDFNAANAAGTKEAFTDFLSRHPAGSLAARARSEIARLEALGQTKPAEAPPPAEPPKAFSEAERKRKDALDKRIAKNARDATAFYERGQFYAQRGEGGPAIADFGQAIKLSPNNPEAYNNRCWMRAVVNELQGALADCNQALKLKQNYVDALDSRGFVNLKLGEFRAALADYDAALRIEPTHVSALYGRGVAKKRLGQSAPAEKDFASALQQNPSIDKEFEQYGLR